MSDLLAFEANDGSWEAYLFGPGQSSAYRDRDGVWSSPAPDALPETLAKAFTRLDDSEADRLNWEAVLALVGPEPQGRRPTPAQLIEAAKDLGRGREAAAMARRTIKRASDQAKAKAKSGTLIFGSRAWMDEFVRRFNEQVQKDNPDPPPKG